MPTLVITGHPSAGKSSFARILAERALAQQPPPAGPTTAAARISTVVIISEETACPGRTKSECYETSKAEKVTREALKSTFDKYCTSSGGSGSTGTCSGSSGGGGGSGSGIVLHRKDADGKGTAQNTTGSSSNSHGSRLVILDSLNYIKGFRYEIHCIAKASGQRHGVVWVLNDPDKCLEWNDQRRQRQKMDTKKEEKSDAADGDDDNNSTAAEDWYQDDDMIRELMRRYEPPDERNRWDKPLYRADVGSILAKTADSNNEGHSTAPKTASAKKSDGDDNAKSTSSSADAVLSRTLYDMHCLTEAIGGDTTTDAQAETKSTIQLKKPASETFKRSAAAGFKRNKARSATAAAAAKGKSTTTTGASEGVAISHLTPEALESLDASNARNDKNAGGTSTINGQSFDNKGEGNTDGSVRQATKRVGRGNKDLNDNATHNEPTTLEELADSILNSFLGKDVIPLKEGKSTALLVNAGANVLHDVDAITQRLVTALMVEQRTAAARGGAGTNGGTLRVAIGQGDMKNTLAIRTNRTVSLSELKRLRREYVKWSSSHPPEDASEIGIARSFLTFVESQL